MTSRPAVTAAGMLPQADKAKAAADGGGPVVEFGGDWRVGWWNKPIPGAPEGKVRRKCDCDGPFVLVRAFHGISTYQCLTCRRVSEVETRTGKTCLNCGKPLTGRQRNWCSDECGREFANHKSRSWWAETVKRRDGYTCQCCGWKNSHDKAEYRQMEAHHIMPLSWGGPEFDLRNGVCLCEGCHDEIHRELGTKRGR